MANPDMSSTMPLEKGVYSRILGEAMYTFKCKTIKVPLVRNALIFDELIQLGQWVVTQHWLAE